NDHGREKPPMEHGEVRRVHADAEPKTQHGKRGEGWRPPRLSQRMPQIADQVRDRSDTACIVMLFANGAQVSEFDGRAAHRLLARQTLAQVCVDLLIEMKAHLVV